MIGEVDAALRALIQDEAVSGTGVEVVFDAPTKDWASRRNSPTVDVYLYDIREDLRRRECGTINSYDGDGRVVGRHARPRHFKLSYLITAWTQRPEDEHRLLSALLACFLRHDALPPELLEDGLAELGLPVPVSIALPPPEDRAFADVWSALGGELKPSLDVVVTAPLLTARRFETGPPVTEPLHLGAGAMAGLPARELRVPRPPLPPFDPDGPPPAPPFGPPPTGPAPSGPASSGPASSGSAPAAKPRRRRAAGGQA